MDFKELLKSARQAIAEGDLDKADKLRKQAESLKSVNDLDVEEPTPITETEEYKAVKAQLDALKLKLESIESEGPVNKAGNIVVTEDETDKKASQPWEDLGKFLKAVHIAAMYPHQSDDRLKAQKAVLGASEGIPSDGGFLVQPNFSDEIFMLEHSQSEIVSRVRKFPVGPNNNGMTINAVDETSRATGSRWGGVRAYWDAEGDSATASKPTFRQMQLKLSKVRALMYATDELLEDTTQLAAVARQAVNEEITWAVENTIMRGTGAGQPEGIIGHASVVSVAKETGQAAATIVADNIIKMWARMWSRSRMSAAWFINQDIEPQLYKLNLPVGTGGELVYMPPGGLSASPYGSIFGRPVIPVEYASTLGTVGDIILADLSQYLMIDKGGVEEASSMHVQFLTGEQTFRWTYRVDGQPGWSSALTPANGSNTQSPFITLATRS